MRSLLTALLLALAALPSSAQFKMQTAAGEAPGPWLFGTIGLGKDAEKKPLTTALKGLAVKVGAGGEASVCYDLDLCRMAGGWSGGKFVTPMNLMSRGEYPSALGTPAFLTSETAGLGAGAAVAWKDPRSEPFGPLPEVRYHGMFADGERVVLKWQIGTTEVLESPWYERRGEGEVFLRTFAVAPPVAPLHIAICRVPEGVAISESTGASFEFSEAGQVKTAAGRGLPAGSRFSIVEGQLFLTLPAGAGATAFRIGIESRPAAAPRPSVTEPPLEDLGALTHGGPAHWPEPVVTKGVVSEAKDQPYVVDTVRLPDPNPWGAAMFIGGFDFFPDGRAAVCTFHGDVFIVSGLDEKLEHVTWRRFATGLYHPLGLKVVGGDVYVTGRDGITRLRDLNGDGEADSYEAFNFDVKVTKSFHEFVFDLQTDQEGNFYFAKAGPVKNGGRGFDQICEHHGCLMRVSPDGRELRVMATGFRAPNGLGTGPNGEITSGDNEGTWTPACRINWINPGGFYGVVDLAHRSEPPTDYDRPICWMPKRVDNSSGGQVWASSEKWGPWAGHLLHLSYGQSTLLGVLMEGVEVPDAPDCCSHVMQGGVVQFPLKFESGIMRARFDPVDGQLYVAGLRGWQTTALRNGCFQRVRYTGAPARMPISLSARKGGVEVKFTCSLDTQQACDPDNWSVEVWNYIWSSAYGSPEISTLAPPTKAEEAGKNGEAEYTPAQIKKQQHDPLVVKRVTAGTDDRSVFIEIPDLKPVMQMSIKYRLRSADGADLSGEIVNTIHALPE